MDSGLSTGVGFRWFSIVFSGFWMTYLFLLRLATLMACISDNRNLCKHTCLEPKKGRKKQLPVKTVDRVYHYSGRKVDRVYHNPGGKVNRVYHNPGGKVDRVYHNPGEK